MRTLHYTRTTTAGPPPAYPHAGYHTARRVRGGRRYRTHTRHTAQHLGGTTRRTPPHGFTTRLLRYLVRTPAQDALLRAHLFIPSTTTTPLFCLLRGTLGLRHALTTLAWLPLPRPCVACLHRTFTWFYYIHAVWPPTFMDGLPRTRAPGSGAARRTARYSPTHLRRAPTHAPPRWPHTAHPSYAPTRLPPPHVYHLCPHWQHTCPPRCPPPCHTHTARTTAPATILLRCPHTPPHILLTHISFSRHTHTVPLHIYRTQQDPRTQLTVHIAC